MIFYATLISIGVSGVVLVSVPIRIRVDSEAILLIHWLFLRVRVSTSGGDLKTEFKLFRWKIKSRAEKQSTKKKKPDKEKKSSGKMSFSLVRELLRDSAVKKVFFITLRLLVRCSRAVKISVLNCDIGLKDYFWQGIVMGLISGLPNSKSLQVNGNFEEFNKFLFVVKISIWRVLSAAVLFLIRFPYIRVFRLYYRLR
jgi:hypothetical protein